MEKRMREQHGGGIYKAQVKLDFSVNINPQGMPQEVGEAVRQAAAFCERYPDPGCGRLREALAKREGLPGGWFTFGNGAAELIFALCQALRPKQALLFAPSFLEYERALESVGAGIRYYRLKEERGFCPEEDLLSCLTGEVDLLFVCNPNNPTGQVIGREFLLRILEKCRQNQIRMVLDECFLDFVDLSGKMTLIPYLKAYKNLAILKSFTKLYAMPGLRLGYLLSAEEALRERLEQVLQPWNISVPAEFAGLAAIEEWEYASRTVELVRKERRFLIQEIKKYGLAEKICPGYANYILFLAQPGLKEALLKEGILIRDCSNYKGLKKGYYRIAVKSHEENEELVQVWRTHMEGRGKWQRQS